MSGGATAPAGPVAGPAAGTAGTGPRVLPRQEVRTRDGVGLCTDVYLPARQGARPAVLVHTPYGRQMLFLLMLAQRLGQAGFAVVLQDSRGRYQSGGSFDMEREETDCLDTLGWLAEQPWCDGRVGLVGISLSNLSNLMAASGSPPAGIEVRALVDIMGSVDAHRNFYRDGALLYHWALPWTTLIHREQMGRTQWQSLDWHALFRHRPLSEAAGLAGGDAQMWRRVLAHPAYEDGWKRFSALERLRSIRAPILHLSGWYDFMLDHALRAYRARAGEGGKTTGGQKLVIGSWNHKTVFASFSAGGRRSFKRGDEELLNLMELVSAWFGRWLDGDGELGPAAREVEAQPEVILYVMGEGSWLGAASFPLAAARVEEWYLTSGGGANSARGDGRLVRQPPPRQGWDRFSFDPDDPVPTVGGAVWPCDWADMIPGPADQTEVEARPDVLVYSSDPLTRDLLVVGPLELELWASTTAADTDFTAKLVDVDPHGVPRILQDGIVRARFHASAALESLLAANRPHRFTLDLQATAHLFRAGHRLRLEVSSSSFPKFDLHLNTAAPLDTATAGMVATQSVFHGGRMASRLRLPVLPRQTFESLRWQVPRSWREVAG